MLFQATMRAVICCSSLRNLYKWPLFPVPFNVIFLVYNFIYLYLFGCAGSLLLGRLFSSCGARASLVAVVCSSYVSQALESWLNSGAWAQLIRGTWDLHGSGIEPVSCALADRLPTTEPPPKSSFNVSRG